MTLDESTGETGRRFAGVAIRERYGLVLLLMLGGYVFFGIDQGALGAVVNAVIWVGILLTALWSPGVPERIRRIGGIATLILLALTVTLGFGSSDLISGTSLLLLAVAQLAAMLAILNRISRHERVNLQTVMGAISGYALIAFVMAAIFHALALLTDTTVLNGLVNDGDYIYYSFITLTTTGYGDITPATDLAKRLAVVEAFAGQVFIITLVARLVSLWGKPLNRSASPRR